MIPAPCTRCQRPVEPPQRRGRPRLRADLCRPCRVWARRSRYSELLSSMSPAPCTRCQRLVDPPQRLGRRLRPDLCRPCRAWASKTRYLQSEKGRAACVRQRQTDKYRAAQARHRATDKYRAAWARHRKTDKCRARNFRHSAFRRARKRKATILQLVDRRAILALDGGLCHLCDLPVDPQAFHLDHVIPLSVEPIHADFNAAIAHPTCNQRKHARLLVLSSSARARWQERRPEHLALLDQHLARLAA
jgi:5-methylcytosine-specific restriction endonuclease McrA